MVLMWRAGGPVGHKVPRRSFPAMNILFLSSEVAPFSKSGGLADVAFALPLALARLGHAVKVVTPLYRSVRDDRIRSLRNRLEEGNWLLLIEAPNGIEMPWTTLQQAKPKAVVRLNEN